MIINIGFVDLLFFFDASLAITFLIGRVLILRLLDCVLALTMSIHRRVYLSEAGAASADALGNWPG